MTLPTMTFGEGQVMAQYRYNQMEVWVRGHSGNPAIGSRDELKTYLKEHRPDWLPALDGLPCPGLGG
jgi:hypothetical protein